MNDVKIESGIPVPSLGYKWKAIVEQMKVGDSVLLDWPKKTQQPGLAYGIRQAGFRVVTRRMVDDTNKVRVWKLAREKKPRKGGA